MADDVSRLVYEAQDNPKKLNDLVGDFLPFIKKCVAQSRMERQSREDALTLAMLTFVDCVRAYREEKGLFTSYVQASIRNRLIDDFRSESKGFRTVPLIGEGEEARAVELKESIRDYHCRMERDSLRLEIKEVSEVLFAWNTSFAELAKICPKQKRTRAQCEYVATLILNNEIWKRHLFEKRRFPGKEICSQYGVSHKIIEKYRKYIATLCVIQSGDYPMLHAFLPMNRKGGVGDV